MSVIYDALKSKAHANRTYKHSRKRDGNTRIVGVYWLLLAAISKIQQDALRLITRGSLEEVGIARGEPMVPNLSQAHPVQQSVGVRPVGRIRELVPFTATVIFSRWSQDS